MIDLIIPIYNSRKTLPLTLMSISFQSIKDKIKVFLIDDCSTDRYEDIISDFINKYDLNIIYHRLDKNAGPAVARQKGIDISNSEYIMFIDSDDLFYDINSVQVLYENILNGYDYVAGFTFDERYEVSFYNEGDLHSKIYRRSFLDKNNIRFNTTRFHEDNYFNNLVLVCNPKMYTLPVPIYVYVYNEESITSSSWEKEFERLEILLSNMRELLEESKKRNCNRELVLFYTAIKIKYFNRIWDRFTENQKDTFKKWLKKYNLELEKYLNRTDYDEVIKEICDTYKY